MREIPEILAEVTAVMERLSVIEPERMDLFEQRRQLWFELRLAGMGVVAIGQKCGVDQTAVSRETAPMARELKAWAAAIAD